MNYISLYVSFVCPNSLGYFNLILNFWYIALFVTQNILPPWKTDLTSALNLWNKLFNKKFTLSLFLTCKKKKLLVYHIKYFLFTIKLLYKYSLKLEHIFV